MDNGFARLRAIGFGLVGLALTAFASTANAAVTFHGSSGLLDATVTFDVVGNNLTVTLTNSSVNDATVPTDILTGVFFDLKPGAGNDPALTKVSAVVGPTSSVFLANNAANTAGAGTVVGGEWAYLNGISVSGDSGISSSGLGVFGPGNVFAGGNLEGPVDPDGIQYGISPAGDNRTTGNGGLNGRSFIQNSVVFSFTGAAGLIADKDHISKVRFQYGTALDETHFNGDPLPPGGPTIPEPASVLIWSGLGLCAVLSRSLRRR